MVKCYSHLDETTAKELQQPPLWTAGNEYADEMAQKAAKKIAEPLLEAMHRCEEVDHMARHIHQRMAAIHVEACKATSAEPLPPKQATTKTSRTLEAERQSGHLMRRRHQNGQWQCALCGRGPGRGSLLDWLHGGQCTAHDAQDDQEKELDQTIRHRFGPEARVDHSHQLRLTGRILWCECCGQYADVQLKGLAGPCRPPRKKGACNIARLQKGQHPKVGKTVDWHAEEGAVTLEQPEAKALPAPTAKQRRRR